MHMETQFSYRVYRVASFTDGSLVVTMAAPSLTVHRHHRAHGLLLFRVRILGHFPPLPPGTEMYVRDTQNVAFTGQQAKPSLGLST